MILPGVILHMKIKPAGRAAAIIISKFSKLKAALLCLFIVAVYLTALFFGNAQKKFELPGFVDQERLIMPFFAKVGEQELAIDKLPMLIETGEAVSLYYSFDGIDFSSFPVRQIFYFSTEYNSVEVFAGGESIYKFPNDNSLEGTNGFVPHADHLVEIFPDDLKKDIEMRLTPDPSFKRVYLGPCELSTKSQILWSMLKKDAVAILIDSLLLLMGFILVLAFFVAGRNSKGLVLIYLGLFLIGYSTLNALMLKLVATVFANKMAVYILCIVSLLLTINSWICFAFYYNAKRRARAFRAMLLAGAAVTIFAAGEIFLWGISLRRCVGVVLFVGGIDALYIAVTMIMDYIAYKDTSAEVVVGGSFLSLIAFWDILMYNSGRQFTLGALGSCSVLVFVILCGVHASREADKFFYAKMRADALEMVAYQDSLTGCKNRSAFDYKMNEYLHRFSKNEIKLEFMAMMMFDADNLKQINDNYSHAHGDRLIVATAKALENFFGEFGVIYRTGGDEFVLICENADIDALRTTAEKFEREVNDKKSYGVSISWGLAKFDAKCDGSLSDLLLRAEKYMYEEKRMHKLPV